MNEPSDAILVAKYGGRFRWTLNPRRRRLGKDGWDAGPVSDWCEVADLSGLEAAGRAADALGALESGLGRIQRQRAAHETTHCTRQAPHWPEADLET